MQDAAVLGQSFTPAGLAAISGLDEAPLLARLRELVRADLLTEERDERSPERGQFAFVQALIREVAYSTLSLRDRKARHLAAARFFESLGDDELAGALAAHYLAAFKATTDPAEAAPLGTQARLALRGAADRAEALGSIRQAIAFIGQALDVATEDSERADLMERILQNAWTAGEYDSALEIAPELRALRMSMSDRSGAAKAAALHSETLYSARQRDPALRVAREALAEFGDLGDDPNLLRIIGSLATASVFTRDYELARVTADRALAAAERLGMPELAARMLQMKGTIAQFQGRLWEAIGLTEGARRIAEQHGLTSVASRINGALANILALDDPRATAAVEREIVEYARRTGAREQETAMIGNMAEDIRRTADWDWIVGELERAIRDDERNVNDLLLETALSEFRVLRGEAGRPELDEMGVRLAELNDLDVSMSIHGLTAAVDVIDGNFGTAAKAWIHFADNSDLNAPYALPKAGHAAVLDGDAGLARAIVDRLVGLGSRGRAIEADMDAIRAGIAAIEGDRQAAQAKFRNVLGRFHELGLSWDVAFVSLVAAARLGTDDPEVAAWVGEARGIFERLRAKPMLALLDRFTESVWSGRGGDNGATLGETVAVRGGDAAETGGTQAEASSSSI